MTQTGKCDTCRQRKVKCDEGKPKCGACRKKDRPCTYTHGKASAFVVQDPNQLTKHGKSKVAPIVYTLESSENSSISVSSTPLELRLSTQKKAESGSGTFQTLAPVSIATRTNSKRSLLRKRRVLDAYLRNLELEASLTLIRPSSAEGALRSKWVDMLGSAPANSRPLSILGTWIQSIPSRVGSNSMLDLAVELLINSHAVYWDDCHSKRQIASVTKSKALRELQLTVSHAQTGNTYETVLATKMHYAAETLLGVDTMYHAIHAFGLAELLKFGVVANVDDEHFWNLIENTYIDDVNEAMLAGRASVYDSDYYLSATCPPVLTHGSVQLTPSQRASMAIMHIFVQCPRLNCMVRHAIMHQEDSESLAAAVSLAEYMWQTDLPAQVAELLQSAVTTISDPPSLNMADVLTETLNFDSVQSMILCTRHWMLQNVLCGLTDTLHRHFPTEMSLSLLPTTDIVRRVDRDAGIRLAESLTWAESVSQRLPLVPLRLHTPLQISIGPWHRDIRDWTVDSADSIDFNQNPGFARAVRMKTWLIDKCNRIHEQWHVSTVDEKSLVEALDSMAGERIPDWLPTRVRFEAQEGQMVIKLDYEKPTGKYQDITSLAGSRTTSHQPKLSIIDNGVSASHSPGVADVTVQGSLSGSESPDVLKTAGDAASPPTAADFLFQSGRNLCSTSGWWPAALTPTETIEQPSNAKEASTFGPSTASRWWPRTSILSNSRCSGVLLDSTHKTSAFQPKVKPREIRAAITLNDRNVNGCMSPAWISSSRSAKSLTCSDGGRDTGFSLPE